MPRETVRGHADAAKTGGFQQSEKSIVFRVAKEWRPGRRSAGASGFTSSRAESTTPCICLRAGRSHHANAQMLPARATRAHSATAAGGSGKWPMPNAHTIASNVSSSNGIESTLASRKVHPGFSLLASSSMRGARSTPVTWAPMRAACMATTPDPQATSSTSVFAPTSAAANSG